MEKSSRNALNNPFTVLLLFPVVCGLINLVFEYEFFTQGEKTKTEYHEINKQDHSAFEKSNESNEDKSSQKSEINKNNLFGNEQVFHKRLSMFAIFLGWIIILIYWMMWVFLGGLALAIVLNLINIQGTHVEFFNGYKLHPIYAFVYLLVFIIIFYMLNVFLSDFFAPSLYFIEQLKVMRIYVFEPLCY